MQARFQRIDLVQSGCLNDRAAAMRAADADARAARAAREAVCEDLLHQPHFESPQFRHVMQPSMSTTAVVLHLPHSCAPSGK